VVLVGASATLADQMPTVELWAEVLSYRELEQLVDNPCWRYPATAYRGRRRQGPVTYCGGNVPAEVRSDVGGRAQRRVHLLVGRAEHAHEAVAPVVQATGLMRPSHVVRPQRHPEVRGARLAEPGIHDGLAIKAPGRIGDNAATDAGVALCVD
jgi:hypothetical protein